jgi:hypothetical protein
MTDALPRKAWPRCVHSEQKQYLQNVVRCQPRIYIRALAMRLSSAVTFGAVPLAEKARQ